VGPVIRKAEIGDANVLSVLATEVWLDTYAQQGVSPAFATHLLEEYSPAAFRHSLQAEGVDILVCSSGNFVLGYTKLVTAPAPLDPTYGTAELATLYVGRHLTGSDSLLVQDDLGGTVAGERRPPT
jgi:diamine N-acetyltransferase